MKHPAEQGGESVFGDGFAAANILKQNHPEAFSILTGTDRRYRSIDSETGWHLEANGPVIALGENGSRVVGIRHNDLDRLPDLPPAEIIRGEYGSHSSSSSPAAIQSFYEGLEHAHAAWDAILSDDDFRLEVSLNAGDTIIVANQVCLCHVKMVKCTLVGVISNFLILLLCTSHVSVCISLNCYL